MMSTASTSNPDNRFMTGLFMTGLALLDRRFVWMAVGAVLFLASDWFLTIKLLQGNPYDVGDACWITHGIGELLIVFGAARLINRAPDRA